MVPSSEFDSQITAALNVAKKLTRISLPANAVQSSLWPIEELINDNKDLGDLEDFHADNVLMADMIEDFSSDSDTESSECMEHVNTQQQTEELMGPRVRMKWECPVVSPFWSKFASLTAFRPVYEFFPS